MKIVISQLTTASTFSHYLSFTTTVQTHSTSGVDELTLIILPLL